MMERPSLKMHAWGWRLLRDIYEYQSIEKYKCDLSELTPEEQIELGRFVFKCANENDSRPADKRLCDDEVWYFALDEFGIRCHHPLRMRMMIDQPNQPIVLPELANEEVCKIAEGLDFMCNACKVIVIHTEATP